MTKLYQLPNYQASRPVYFPTKCAQCIPFSGMPREVPFHWVLKLLWGGVLTYLAKLGCAALMGHFFYKKSLNMGPVFTKKSVNMGQLSDWAQIFGFSHGENPEIFEKWAYFSRKILKNGYPFLPKITLKDG